ncbi:hypothetical protein CDL12_11595 [Handroanthus impetiginosus]|uniref:Uncharacterized protein n=1 Tax=Handroanthus impetiginosus TaxID=429701 RepID=A0A2G9HE38_9LAMI|nr:hypothetical protein CDL12_11595 [Handroanthus impetiginosus]
MITEEFSFPIISSNNVVHLTVLPPLWRISSINQSDADRLELQENAGRNIINKRKVISRSFSEVEGEIINKENNDTINLEKAEAEAEAEAQEKMDMLWEDFNDEAASNYSVENTTASDTHELFNDHTTNNDFHVPEYSEFEGDQPNSTIVHESERPCRKRKKQLETVGKMIKKLFLLQNMARIKKRGPTPN